MTIDFSHDPYLSYLASKQSAHQATGFKSSNIHPLLFDWQQLVVQWALSLGKAALFEERGLGKTLQQIEWARHVHTQVKKPVLIVCPLAVARQTIREGEKIGIPITYVRSMDDVKMSDSPFIIINYDMLQELDPRYFGGLVLDECFAPDTLIDTPNGQKPISELREGDLIINASGIDVVSDVHRREVPYAIKVTINGKSIISSPNHPFFTQRGYVSAQDLEPGDYALETSTAMRLVWDGISTKTYLSKNATVLREILLSEMANEPTGNISQSSRSTSGSEKRQEKISLAQIEQSKSSKGNGKNTQLKPYEQPRNQEKSLPKIETDEPRTFRAWGEWKGIDRSTDGNVKIAWRGMDSGISLITGEADSGLSLALQARLSQSRAESLYRGGWSFSSLSERSGQEKGREISLARVDSIEVLELGHPELDKYRDVEGKLYFYDLGATQHPSYSINGVLVHNSSILKSYTGKTKQFILHKFVPSIAYRLFCTATPSPNDIMELGNHSEGLDAMDSNQMLSNWFQTARGKTLTGEIVAGKYDLRPYAEKDFWRWVTTWAAVVSKPSDLGFSDEGYIRQPLKVNHHLLEVDHSRAWETMNDKGQYNMFLGNKLSATQMWAEKAITFEDRCKKGIELIEGEPDEYQIVWCDTKDESAYLARELKALYPDNIVEVKGDDPLREKEAKLDAFSTGEVPWIVTKSKIAGMGLNWQHCARHKFVSVNFKWEEWYQAVGRTDRFGNPRQTIVDMIYTETEDRILKALDRKGKQHAQMHGKVRDIIAEFGLWRTDKKTLNVNLGNEEMRLPKWLS